MKLTKSTAKAIRELGLATIASHWTTGTGRHISKRTIPYFYRELPAEKAVLMPGKAGVAVKKLLKAHPRAKKIIVCDDVRAVNRLLKQHDFQTF